MLDHVLFEITAAVDAETAHAKAEYGMRYSNAHEAYGVLAEELYEADEEYTDMVGYSHMLIGYIHKGDNDLTRAALECLMNRATKAACELVQVAAVCRKALEGLHEEERH